jgi:tRNA pseudouridine38-40 synthase
MIYQLTSRPDWVAIAIDATLESGRNEPIHGSQQILAYCKEQGLVDRLYEVATRPGGDSDYYEDDRYLIRWKRKDGLAQKIRVYDKTTELRRVKLVLAYDGSEYRGFQVQPDVMTIAGVLETQVTLVNDYLTRVHGASRTDEGVHALGQVAHFDSFHDFDAARWRVILNHALPQDVYVKEVTFVPLTFHARYSVARKVYEYVLNTGEYDPLRRRYEWTIPPVDAKRFGEVLQTFVGTHDFTSFCTKGKESTIRTLRRADVRAEGERLILTFEAEGFLHHMIRLIVSSALRIARGELAMSVEDLFALRSRTKTNHIAPPSGLYLKEVHYDE